MREKGCIADLVCPPHTPLAEKASREGITVITMPLRGEVDLPAVLRIRKLLKKGRYAVIHAHTSHAHTLAALAAAGLETKVVVSRRVDFSIFRRSFFGLNRVKYRHGYDVIIAVSEAIKDVLVRDGVPAEKIRVVRSGIDPERFTLRDRTSPLPPDIPMPPGSLLVLNTAHLTPHKGQIHLIRAFPLVLREVPEAFLCIAGEGELRDVLRDEIRKLGLEDRAFLAGFREDVGVLLSHASAFVMPSVKEGLGTAVLDAFAMGVAVVASRAGGLVEMIEDGRNGLLAEPGSPESLAGALVRVLRDESFRRKLGEAGRESVLRRFSYRRTVDETLEIYRELITKNRPDERARENDA